MLQVNYQPSHNAPVPDLREAGRDEPHRFMSNGKQEGPKARQKVGKDDYTFVQSRKYYKHMERREQEVFQGHLVTFLSEPQCHEKTRAIWVDWMHKVGCTSDDTCACCASVRLLGYLTLHHGCAACKYIQRAPDDALTLLAMAFACMCAFLGNIIVGLAISFSLLAAAGHCMCGSASLGLLLRRLTSSWAMRCSSSCRRLCPSESLNMNPAGMNPLFVKRRAVRCCQMWLKSRCLQTVLQHGK